MIPDKHLRWCKKTYNSVILSNIDGKFSKVHQAIFFSAPIGLPNMMALAKILFEIYCTQDFQILFSKGHNSKRGHNSDMKTLTGQQFSQAHTESVNEISKS